MGKGDTADYSGCRECSICLGSVLVCSIVDVLLTLPAANGEVIQRPYQCLFMAACAHVWHYKCISRLLHSPDYPMFQCPNCRAFTDLSAEVDDTNDLDVEETKEGPTAESTDRPESRLATQSPENGDRESPIQQEAIPEETDLVTDVENLNLQDEQRPYLDTEDVNSSASPAPTSSNDDLARSATVSIPGWQATQPLNVPCGPSSHLRAETPIRSETSDDTPLTPRNDSGPLAFDGRAGMQR